jgi:hypothetical protein
MPQTTSQQSASRQAASQQAPAQAPKSAKISPLVAGLGAAFVASGVAIAIMMSGPAAVTDQAASDTSKECKLVLRQFLVSTESGSGTVRLREGSYLSPPIALSSKPQTVTFPIPRPQDAPSEAEVITIEGNATDVVLTSPVTSWRQVFNNVSGVVAFESRWAAVKGC